jgi:hypothetical protein
MFERIFSWSKYIACNYLPNFHIAFTRKSVPTYAGCIKVAGVRTSYKANSEDIFIMEMTEPMERDMHGTVSKQLSFSFTKKNSNSNRGFFYR